MLLVPISRSEDVLRVKFTHSQVDTQASECWKCGTQVKSSSLFCADDSCNAVQHVPYSTNPFKLLNVPETFQLDLEELQRNYKTLQKLLHPDLFATKQREEQEASVTASSTVNQAYQALSDPIVRADKLLQCKFGITILDETSTVPSDSQLMMEVFEMREELEDADAGIDNLNRLLLQTQSLLNKAEDGLIQATTSDRDVAAARLNAIRMKYYSKLLEEILHKMEDDS